MAAKVEFIPLFNTVTGKFYLTTKDKRPVRVPNATEMIKLWTYCGGSKYIVVHDLGPKSVVYSLTLHVSPATAPSVRQDFVKFLALECSTN